MNRKYKYEKDVDRVDERRVQLPEKLISDNDLPSTKTPSIVGPNSGEPNHGHSREKPIGEYKVADRGSDRIHGMSRLWNGFFWAAAGLLFLAIVGYAQLSADIDLRVALSFIAILAFGTCIFHWAHNRTSSAANAKAMDLLRWRLEELQDRTWELRESEERHRSLADAFGDLMMHRSGDGTITYVNDAFAKAFGGNTDEYPGRAFDVDFLEEGVYQADKLAGTIRQVKVETPNGIRWFAWLDLSIRDETTGGNSVRTVARDITEQKRIELKLREASRNAQASSRAKSRFLASVSHEMRTPLNGILGMSGLLADTSLTPEQSAYVDAVHESGQALLTLIEDILDITLIEAGKLEIKPEPTNLTYLVESVCELLASRAHIKGISISSHIARDVPELVKVDSGRLRQVLINLVGNALKFTETGGVNVSLSKTSANGKGNRLLFEVADTGVGISKSDQATIFGEFAQVDSASTRKHGGAGLGLAISRRILRKMGGEIELESARGKGSIFRFWITIPQMEKMPSKQIMAFDGKRVLVAGGTPFESAAISGYVTSQGGVAGILASGRSYERGNESWDTVLVDQNFTPDPVSFLKKINLENAKPSRTIILLEPENRSRLDDYLKSGFDGYLIKPVRSATLLAHLHGSEPEATDDRESSPARQWGQILKPADQPLNILLAEDNDINALLARSVLEKAGHMVMRAENGEEALALCLEKRKQGLLDLVFMDLQMPVMDGLDALKFIREAESREASAELPVYILTADEQPVTRQKAAQLGATGFLTKPLDLNELLNVTSCKPAA